MKNKAHFCGLAALVFLVFGLLMQFLVTSSESLVAPIHFAAAALLLIVFFAGGGIETLRSREVKRRAGFGASVTLYSALFVGILIVLNVVAAKQEWFRFDSTEQKVFTLAPQTTKVLDAVTNPIQARGFFLAGQLDPQLDDLMKRMSGASANLMWSVVDPEKEPTLVERLGINESGTIHFSFRDDSSGRSVKISREANEQEVVNAILKLTRGGEKIVYYLEGHGEPALDGADEQGYLFLKESIEGENVILKPLVLANAGRVPEDADSLIIAGPERALLAEELEAITAYLKGGGNAVLLHEPRRAPVIPELVRPIGIAVGNDVIVDQVVRLFSGPTLGVQPMVTTYGRHEITESFSEGTLFSLASSVRISERENTPGTRTELARTSETSWAETNLAGLFGEEAVAELQESDVQGPVSLAVAYDGSKVRAADSHSHSHSNGDSSAHEEHEEPGAGEAKEEASDTQAFGGRIVVIGDADFVTNVLIRQVFNRDFFLNALNWTLGDNEKVSIRARSLRASTKGVSPEQFNMLFLLTSVLFPELLLLFGLSVWWSRRG